MECTVHINYKENCAHVLNMGHIFEEIKPCIIVAVSPKKNVYRVLIWLNYRFKFQKDYKLSEEEHCFLVNLILGFFQVTRKFGFISKIQ